MTTKRLTRNSVRCLKCGEEIVSTHRHHFITCKCGNVSADGGIDYKRRVFRTEEWEETSQYEDLAAPPQPMIIDLAEALKKAARRGK